MQSERVEIRKKYAVRMVMLFMAIVSCSMVMTGCHSTKRASGDKDHVTETVRISGLKGIQKKIVEEALSWRGTPYKYAGSDKKKGTDCSGMVIRVYQDAAGIKLPRSSREQASFCKKIGRKSVRPGDLVFFATGKKNTVISHVGIMIDDVRFVHASTRKGVIVSEVTEPYYERTFRMYGRVPR